MTQRILQLLWQLMMKSPAGTETNVRSFAARLVDYLSEPATAENQELARKYVSALLTELGQCGSGAVSAMYALRTIAVQCPEVRLNIPVLAAVPYGSVLALSMKLKQRRCVDHVCTAHHRCAVPGGTTLWLE